ncbi:cutinase family protein [Nocardia cyriacigeorgica]|uniref:cutinase family protein n=2 Tax=Nocardiaceae TaxID=85025 RepID=UPI001E3FA9FA|nr:MULTISPECIES: cutinase family protein [Nocardia]
MLGHLLGPVAAADPSLIARSYISYPASFGGAPGTGGGTDPYAASASTGLNTLLAESEHVAAICPGTSQAIVGYSQGAQVASGFAQMVGAGEGPVAPQRVAAVILYSDPERAPGFTGHRGTPRADDSGLAPRDERGGGVAGELEFGCRFRWRDRHHVRGRLRRVDGPGCRHLCRG